MKLILFIKYYFLGQSSHKSFYIGGRFLTQCEVNFLSESSLNAVYPWLNLNDAMYIIFLSEIQY